MRMITFLISIIGLAVSVAACGSSAGGSPPGTSYFVASNANAVLLITWNSAGSGTITYDSVNTSGSDPSAPDSLSVDTSPVGVSINGSEITFTGFLGATVNGSLDGSTLTITSAPDTSTGQITTDTLSASDPSAYNSAVNVLDQTISAVNSQAAQQQAQSQQQEQAAAAQQDAVNKAADAKAQAACNQFGGSWTSPGTVDYSANGFTSSITDGPQNGACDSVSYLGSDDSTYYVTIYFSSDGTAQPPGSSTGTATQSECQQGYYPDQPAGQTSQPPGHWSATLGLCLP